MAPAFTHRKPLHARRVHSPSRHAPGVTTISAGPLVLLRSPWNAHFLVLCPLCGHPVACAPSSCGGHSVAIAEVPDDEFFTAMSPPLCRVPAVRRTRRRRSSCRPITRHAGVPSHTDPGLSRDGAGGLRRPPAPIYLRLLTPLRLKAGALTCPGARHHVGIGGRTVEAVGGNTARPWEGERIP